MSVDAGNVRVPAGSAGFVAVAPLGTPLPTTATVALNAAFDELGFISEDGITESQGTSETKIKAWQGAAIVRTIRTEHSLTFKFAALETNAAVLQEFYNQVAFDGVVEITGDQRANKSWVIHAVDGSDLIRVVVPEGQVSLLGDVVYAASDAMKYEFTVEAYPDNSSIKAYKYLSGPDS